MTSSLPIAIEYTPAHEQGGGIGRYVRELIAALAAIDSTHRYHLFVSGTDTLTLESAPGRNFTWKPTRVSPSWLARIWHRARVPLPVETFTGPVSCFHATDFVLPPTHRKTRTLLTVHDLSFVRVPQTASPSLKRYLDKVVPRSLQRVDHVLADSAATKQDIINIYGTDPQKISVLLSGVDQRFSPQPDNVSAVRQRYRIPDRPYILSVGTVQPRKNYGRLIEALASLRRDDTDVDLVIAGGRGWLDDPIYDAVCTHRLESHVHFIGFAADKDLPALYTGAAAFAFPSLYEGFGLPVLESMACGTPVLTSNISSLPEVAGHAALMVDPYDTQAIAHHLNRLIKDTGLRQQLIERGFAQAARFTWHRAAEELLRVYRSLGVL